jgi:hypothetical protein
VGGYKVWWLKLERTWINYKAYTLKFEKRQTLTFRFIAASIAQITLLRRPG